MNLLKVYEKEAVICAECALGNSGKKVFVYLVDGMLIDTGAEKMLDDLIPFFQEHPFDQAVLTHNHEDHTGTAAWIEEHLHVPIYGHPIGLEECRRPGVYPMYRQLTWGGRKAFNPEALGETVQSRQHNWQVLYTPGHADDHVAFYHPESGRLFSGDLFVSPKTKVLMATESIPQLIRSLETLLATNFRSLYCSHAGYFANGREMVEKKHHYLQNLTSMVRELDRQGLTAPEIRDRLLPGDYPIIAFSQGEWDSLHAVESILND